jgi:signal transduction histidine kinase
MNKKNTQSFLILRLISAIVLILLISLGIFYLVMHPPMSDLGLMAQFLTITAVISALAGYGATRLGLVERSPSLQWTLLSGYILASVLTFFNVWITARLMFASQHDLSLATVLLIFASGIALILGSFFSSRMVNRIHKLDDAANEIKSGNLETRIEVSGNDEIAKLSSTFNQMAARLQEADKKQREIENLRRDLVAWAGHDLQTPLASIRAIMEALADGVVTDSMTRMRYFRTAQKDIQTLSSLIDDLSQMAQLDAGGLQLQQETAALADLISDTLESFSEQARTKGIRLEGSVDDNVDPLQMDVRRIGRVLNNLVDNAIQHTPSGGYVAIKAKYLPGWVNVEVWDTGEGISAEDRVHVFERFFRGEKSRNRTTGGAGLGLAIAKGIIEAHGGQIGVESNPQNGSRFFFILPKN